MQKNYRVRNFKRGRLFGQTDYFKLFGRQNRSKRLGYENCKLFKDKRRFFRNGQHNGRKIYAKGRQPSSKTIQIKFAH